MKRRRRWLRNGCLLGVLVLVAVYSIHTARSVVAEFFLVDCSALGRSAGLSLQLYAYESEGRFFPPLRNRQAPLTVDSKYLVPAYSSEENFHQTFRYHGVSSATGQDFYYLGYAVENEEEMAAFAAAYELRRAEGGEFTGDLSVPTDREGHGGRTIKRLTKHTAESRSMVPLLIEKSGHYHRPGGYVVYTDGAVEFIVYPGKWPMSKATMDRLKTLEEVISVSTASSGEIVTMIP